MAQTFEARQGPATTPLLERETHVSAIRSLVAAAREGEGRFVVIEGSAGIGKTRLLGEGRTIAAEAGMRLLFARGGEFEGEFAYGIVRQLFEPLLAAAPADVRADLLSGAAGLVEPLFSSRALTAPGDALSLGEGSFAVLHGLYWLAANVAYQQPTLVAIDDLHWADSSSLRWLLYLSGRLEGVPLLVVATTRPPEGESRDPTLIAKLLADPDAVAIRPEPLGPGSIAALARELYGMEPDQAFCEALARATGGNPLFIGAVLDTCSREGISPTAPAAPRLLEIGAQGVARAVAVRLARLSPAALALLRAAAILGDGSPLHVAASLSRVGERDLGPAARSLLRIDLIRREDPIEFSHPVVRSAVYATLDVVERAAAHRQAAELLIAGGAPPESAAAHLVLTVRGEDPFVVSTLREAADRALGQGAAAEAVAYLSRALEEASDPAVRAEVVVELGLAEGRTSGPAAADHLREGFEQLSEPARRGEVALELARVLFFTDRLHEAIELLERTLDQVDRVRDADLYERLLAELISAAWWEPDTYPVAKRLIEEVDRNALHGGFGSDVLLGTLSHHEQRLGADCGDAVDLARRALASGRLSDSGVVAYYYAVFAFPNAGLFDEAIRSCEDAVVRARRRGDIAHVGLTLLWRGRAHTLRGDLAAAVADLQEATALSLQHGVHVSWPYLVGFLALALLDRGDCDEAARVIEEAGFAEKLPMNLHLNFFRLARARLRIETGAHERGVEEMLEIGELVTRVPFDNPAFYPWRGWAAEGLRLLGRREEALALAERELEVARRWGVPHVIGAALRQAGVITADADGEARLEEAVQILAGSGARVEHARALVDLGALLRRTNRRSRAREYLREGVSLAQSIGAIGLAERGNEEIAATGARPRKMLQTGLDALTASERRVAQQAAEGMSNKEIAQALFVTVKTVEVHLSSAYRKLDITSRAQLESALFAAAQCGVPKHP